MDMKEVESSNVQAIGFKPDDGEEDVGVLHIRFGNGVTYAYKDIPRFLADELFDSESIGRFVNLNIRNKYEGEKLDQHSEA